MSEDTLGAVRPGALTALLQDLVRAPAGAGWESPPLPGDRIGRFEIVREIGRGGFGVVYEARDAELGRTVALKALRVGRFDSALRAPLGTDGGSKGVAHLAEAEAAARLAHPNIVHLYDVGRCDRGAYLIMELLRGKPLSDWVGQQVPVRDVLRVGIEIARGLAHAHAHGIVHRDLKPANVIVCEDGQVKVLDFGLAHVFGREAVQGGTPAYMAPEQARGEVGDERSDLFGLGVMLDHLLATAERRRVPPAFTRLVARLRAAEPAARPASAGEVLEHLISIQKALEPKRLLWTTAVVAVIAIAAAVGLALRARPLPPGRLVVALADIENGTGDAALDDLSVLLGTVLEESKRVSLMARGRLLGMAREASRAMPARLDEKLVRDMALGASANVLIAPAARRAGEGFEIEVRGIDLRRNEPLFTIRERATARPGVPEALDRLSDRIRAELREETAARKAPRFRLAQVTTPNPDAWREYAEGVRLESEGRAREAMNAYQRSLAADEAFPLSHYRLAMRASWFDDETAQRHFDAAMRHADRLPPKDRLLLEARRAFMEERIDEALASWDKVIAGWPQDQEAYRRAGNALMVFYSDLPAARPYFEKALELAALTPDAAIATLVALGRLDDALPRAERWARESPSPSSFALLSVVHRRRGEHPAALDAARRVVELGSLPGSTHAGVGRNQYAFWSFVEADAVEEIALAYRRKGTESFEVLALQGRMRAAIARFDEEVGAEARRLDATDRERAEYHAFRGALLWGTDDADRVYAEIQEQLRLGSGVAYCAAHFLAAMGDARRSARLASLWAGLGSPKGSCARLYRHIRDWKRGERDGAEQGLQAMYGPVPAYHRGIILAELGRDRDAIEAFRSFRRAPEWTFDGRNVSAYPRSLYLEAVSLERLGERDEARRLVERLLRLWAHADQDLPYLAEAKALRTRLVGSGT